MLTLTRLGQLSPFIVHAEKSGFEYKKALKQLKLPADILEIEHEYVFTHQLFSSVHYLSGLQQDASYSLMVAENSGLAMYGQFANAIGEHWSLLQTLNHWVKAVNHESAKVEIYIESSLNGIWLWQKHSLPVHAQGFADVELYDLQMTVNLVNHFTIYPWLPNFVNLASKSMAHWQAAKHFYEDCNITHQANKTGIFIPSVLLTNTPKSTIPAYNQQYHLSPDFLVQFQQVLNGLLHFQSLNIQTVSWLMSVSERTLQRRLKQSNTSFRQELSKARYDKACKSLAEGKETVSEISLKLGYSNVTHFCRAFKSHSGYYPKSFKIKTNQANQN
ncbi:helix-turn-helix domain-containing protein [Motilimonas sp. KMU-193]|uniref:helix-turn-helix domain-containing protein n=1 Tax=Motilimonas sp. KMU-193 TaxID=3388668 RepID=UPI00396B0176